jgi:hypothetical protein
MDAIDHRKSFMRLANYSKVPVYICKNCSTFISIVYVHYVCPGSHELLYMYVQKLTVLLVIPRVQEMCGMVLAAVSMLWLLSLAISLLLMILFCNHESANDCARTVINPMMYVTFNKFLLEKTWKKKLYHSIHSVTSSFFYIYAYINSYLSPSKYYFTFMRQAFWTVLPDPEIVFGQYIKKVRLILEKIRPISIKGHCNIHTKGQFEMKLKFFFVSKVC